MSYIGVFSPAHIARGGVGLRAVASAIGGTLRRWERFLNTRQGLEGLDDRMLSDLGISRAQAQFELSRAPWENRKPDHLR